MEIWDLYDENRNLTGKELVRGNEVPDGYFHLVVHIWIKNNKGEFLISQRSRNKRNNPLMWESTGGSVLKGETSIEGALRETKEEIGLDFSESDGKLVSTKIRKIFDGRKFNDIVDIWLFKYNGEVDLKKSTTDEVEQCKWVTKDEIKKLYEDGKFVKTLRYVLEEDFL